MVYKIIFLQSSINDLDWIFNFISCWSVNRAKFFISQIKNKIWVLSNFPLSWKEVLHPVYKNLREIIYKNYRIVYEIDWEKIFIVSIFNSSMNLFKN